MTSSRIIAAGFSPIMMVGALAGACCIAGLLLLGCTQAERQSLPSVMLDTQAGFVPLFTPNQTSRPMPGGPVVPPPGLGTTLPVPARTAERNGTYSGTAEPLVTGGGVCITPVTVSGFRVQGNSVRYGGFRGTIAADDGLWMAYGQRWIIGQFDGAMFRGQIDIPGPFTEVGCTYMLNLQRTGA